MGMVREELELIPFNFPTYEASEMSYVQAAMCGRHRHGAGEYTARAVAKLKAMTGAKQILLTHSCTGALELATLLMELGPGDEVILPSFTFSSTANVIVLRGATPVFADIDPLTQCLDPKIVEKLITSNTRAILPVHYAGLGCDMQRLGAIANKYGLVILEDAAQALGSFNHGQALGTFGELGAFSFHDSKNISCGEGGALLINDERLVERAEIIWEKGTNRSQFMRGEVDKYTWVDLGSSFLPSEITAAFLLGQLEQATRINAARCELWERYYQEFASLEEQGLCRRPHVPAGHQHNGHIFYLILPTPEMRNDLLDHLKSARIGATFHYVPLHDSPAGRRFGRAPLPMPNTAQAGHCLVRLPLFPSLTVAQQTRIIQSVNNFMLQAAIKNSIAC